MKNRSKKIFSVEKDNFEIVSGLDNNTVKQIEKVARVCTDSGHLIKPGSDRRLVKELIRKNHGSAIEFGFDITVMFSIDRAIANELVRHRLCSFQQKSTRYVNDGKNLAFIKPKVCSDKVLGNWYANSKINLESLNDIMWLHNCFNIHQKYISLIEGGWTPEYARSILPLCLKTTLYMKANIRNWRHVFNLRCAPTSHPQLVDLMKQVLKTFSYFVPVIFDDLKEKYLEDY